MLEQLAGAVRSICSRNIASFLLVVRPFLGLQQGSQHDVLECGVLREQIERLEHHDRSAAGCLRICRIVPLGGMVGSVEAVSRRLR